MKGKLAEDFKLGLQSANTIIKSVYFSILEMELIEMIHRETPGTILVKGFEHLSQWDALMDALL